MFPETHLVTSWVIGAKTTDNARDCRLVALAGILPDANGLGIIIDAANKALGYKKTLFYEHYHHYLLHGALGAILIAGLLACFARHKWRVALLALAVFHLHLLCDFVGSRGPSPEDLWPIFYLGPFDKDPMWIWKGQWPLDAWPNRLLSVGLFLYALWLAVQKGYSFVGVFSRRLDEQFVVVLRRWQGALAGLRGRPLLLWLTTTLALTSFSAGAAGVTKGLPRWTAQEVQFPADAGIIDVTVAPYGAKGDGVTDDTQAIQKAITDNMRGAILYFPNGTYLVSSTLKWSKKNSKGEDCWGNFTIQGQSAARTILRLKDGSFTNPNQPQAIMYCGFFGSADWFHNYVKNITFDTGRNNPGAIGLQFYSNNTGSVREVAIVSQDGQGVIGLDLAHHDMNGPLLVKNVLVRGFAVGIQTGHSVNSQTMEHVWLEGQSQCGMANNGQSVSVRGLQVQGAPVAVRNLGGHSFMTLLDSEFRGGSAAAQNPAIENEGALFARNIRTRRFQSALKTSRGQFAGGNQIREFVSEPVLSLFPSPGQSLNLPIKETPLVPLDPPAQWVSVRQFHKGGEDYSPAIQAAIDSGATTVYFPEGAYKIGRTVVVRGKVRRLIGLNSWLAESAPGADEKQPRFRVEDGAAPVVVMEQFRAGFGGRVFIEYAAKRTLVIKEAEGIPSRFQGTGEVFMEDTTASPHGGFVFTGRQKVWARQFNVENFVNEKISATLDNQGSDIWILGLKTEQGNRLVATRNGGRTEILGGLVYTVTSHEGRPAFINEDSAFSMSIQERCFMGKPMDPVVRETRGGITRSLGKTSVIGLYVGYPQR